eukprot:7381504-Prymnesium_polylepis.1
MGSVRARVRAGVRNLGGYTGIVAGIGQAPRSRVSRMSPYPQRESCMMTFAIETMYSLTKSAPNAIAVRERSIAWFLGARKQSTARWKFQSTSRASVPSFMRSSSTWCVQAVSYSALSRTGVVCKGCRRAPLAAMISVFNSMHWKGRTPLRLDQFDIVMRHTDEPGSLRQPQLAEFLRSKVTSHLDLIWRAAVKAAVALVRLTLMVPQAVSEGYGDLCRVAGAADGGRRALQSEQTCAVSLRGPGARG